MFDTLYSITITQAAAALRAGELTSAALVRHALEAVRLHDGTLNAMLRVSASALEEAERCDAEAAQGSFRGPLHGIPLVIKDNIDVRGLPTTVASPLFTHAAPAKGQSLTGLRRDIYDVICLEITDDRNFCQSILLVESGDDHFIFDIQIL